MKLPDLPRDGRPVHETVRDLINYLRAITVTNVKGGRVMRSANGTTLIFKPGKSTTTSAAANTVCNFGEIITYNVGETPTTGIKGGVFYCGDKNFNVANYDLDLETPIDVLVQITLTGVTPNKDDDDELLLPGIETATGTPAWGTVTVAAGYTDNTNPTVAANGTLVIPIGRLVIASGAATLTPVACGNITADHCAGTLSHTRG